MQNGAGLPTFELGSLQKGMLSGVLVFGDARRAIWEPHNVLSESGRGEGPLITKQNIPDHDGIGAGNCGKLLCSCRRHCVAWHSDTATRSKRSIGSSYLLIRIHIEICIFRSFVFVVRFYIEDKRNIAREAFQRLAGGRGDVFPEYGPVQSHGDLVHTHFYNFQTHSSRPNPPIRPAPKSSPHMDAEILSRHRR